jgi:hypothetical protein
MTILRILICFIISFPAAASSTDKLNFQTNVKLINFTTQEEDKINRALAIIREVIISEEFKQRILNHRYRGELRFNDNNGLSNLDIYHKIMAGAEILNPQQNHAMDIELELIHEENNIIGHTYPNTPRIWINQKYFSKYNPNQVAENLFHEWLHKLGFDHSIKYNLARKHSVPYAIGQFIKRIAATKY